MSALHSARIYRNVMEPLVTEEVQRQLTQLPSKVAQYINEVEVVAYALNRLPPLYATSEQGWQQQQVKAKRTMGSQIMLSVRQALAAVQRDPLRSTVPLSETGHRDASSALRELKELLGLHDLSWQNLVDTVERELVRTARGEITWRKRGHRMEESQTWKDNRYRL